MKEQYYPLSFSSVKAFAQSPAHFIAYKARKQHETPAMRFGTAVHMATLEPMKFAEAYKVLTVRRGTAAYKKLCEDHPQAEWLSQSEYEEICNVRDAVQRHEQARTLLAECSAFEQELRGNLLGYPFRGFADGVSLTYTVDLKTTQKGSPRDFTSDAYRQKYHVQGYIYTALLWQALGKPIRDHWLITVEKTAPYVVTCYKLERHYIERGREELERILKQFEKWDGEPHGYDTASPNGFFTLDVPAWAI